MLRLPCRSCVAVSVLAIAFYGCAGDPQHAENMPATAHQRAVSVALLDSGMTAPVGDAAESVDATAGVPDTGTSPGTDAVPAFDSATDAHVRAVVARGLVRGNRREVFAKVGDSITESASFLMDCGFGWYDAGSHSDLASTIEFYRMVSLGTLNPLNRGSACATAGWTTGDALQGYPDAPLTHELDAIHPMWAIVMYGTNDLQVSDINTFTTNLGTIIDDLEARDTVAILSTIPPRGDDAGYASLAVAFSDVIRGIASSRHLPLIDYNVAMQPLPNQGLSADGIHPSVYDDPTSDSYDSCSLIDDGLQFGYNVRNYTALQMLTRLRGY